MAQNYVEILELYDPKVKYIHKTQDTFFSNIILGRNYREVKVQGR